MDKNPLFSDMVLLETCNATLHFSHFVEPSLRHFYMLSGLPVKWSIRSYRESVFSGCENFDFLAKFLWLSHRIDKTILLRKAKWSCYIFVFCGAAMYFVLKNIWNMYNFVARNATHLQFYILICSINASHISFIVENWVEQVLQSSCRKQLLPCHLKIIIPSSLDLKSKYRLFFPLI